MKTFKTFLVEYLTDEQKARYSHHKISDEAAETTNHFFGRGNDTKEEPLKNYEYDKSEVHKAVERHLGKEIDQADYVRGHTTDKYGRTVRIGRMITDPKLREDFAADNTRAGGKSSHKPYTVSVVRSYHVFGQTNPDPDENHPSGHNWRGGSCKNLRTGFERNVLPHEARNGTVAMFVKDHKGEEIYRATLQPCHSEDGISPHSVYTLAGEYGTKHPSFTAHAHDLAARLSHPQADRNGLYRIDDSVYDDRDMYDKTLVTHPGLTSHEIKQQLRDTFEDRKRYGSRSEKNEAIHSLILHPNATDDTFNYAASEHKDQIPDGTLTRLARRDTTSTGTLRKITEIRPGLKTVVVAHRNAPQELFDQAISQPDGSHFKNMALTNPVLVTPEIHKRALASTNDQTAAVALSHPLTTAKHVQLLYDYHKDRPDSKAVMTSIAKSKHATPEMLDQIANRKDHALLPAVSNPNIRKETLTHIIKHGDDLSASIAVESGANIDSDHITHYINRHSDHRVPETFKYVIGNNSGKITGEHISQYIDKYVPDYKNDYETVKALVTHPNFTSKHMDQIIDSAPEEDLQTFLTHGGGSHHQMLKAIDRIGESARDYPRSSLHDDADYLMRLLPQHVVKDAAENHSSEYVRHLAQRHVA